MVDGRKETTHQLAGTANGLLGLQSFLSSSCGGNVIKVFCDNSTAVAYVNNMGGGGGGNSVPELHSLFHLGTLLVV